MEHKLNIKKIDDLTPEVIYSICMGNSVESLTSTDENGIDEQKLSTILSKYDMLDYKEMFLKDKVIIKYKIETEEFDNDFNRRNINHIQKVLSLLRIALIFKKSRKSKFGVEVTVRNMNNLKETINDKSISNLVEDRVLELLFEMSIGLNVSKDLLEIAKIVNKNNTRNKKFEVLEKSVYYENPDMKEELYREYRRLKIKSEVTEEFLRNNIVEYELKLNEIEIPKGVPSKNHLVGILAAQLSFLIQFRDFINQNQISEIQKFKFSNDSKRFIYEILELLGLIDKELLEEHNLSDPKGTNTKPHFIKSLIKQCYKKTKQSAIYGYNPDEKINNIWMQIHKNG